MSAPAPPRDVHASGAKPDSGKRVLVIGGGVVGLCAIARILVTLIERVAGMGRIVRTR